MNNFIRLHRYQYLEINRKFSREEVKILISQLEPIEKFKSLVSELKEFLKPIFIYSLECTICCKREDVGFKTQQSDEKLKKEEQSFLCDDCYRSGDWK